jgi:hypothetical protein
MMVKAVPLLLLIAALNGACENQVRTSSPAASTPAASVTIPSSRGDQVPGSSPAETLDRAQQAVEKAGSYRVSFTGHNLVLPRWGGVEAGELRISEEAGRLPLLAGRVERTGDGFYDVRFTEGVTFFQRSSCPQLTRVPGGGNQVFQPFLLGTTRALATAKNPEFAATTTQRVVPVKAEMPPPLGTVVIELDRDTYLPARLVKDRDPRNGSESIWTFGGWGEPLERPGTPLDVRERGPGGQPC